MVLLIEGLEYAYLDFRSQRVQPRPYHLRSLHAKKNSISMSPLLASLLAKYWGNRANRFKLVQRCPVYGFLFLSLCGKIINKH